MNGKAIGSLVACLLVGGCYGYQLHPETRVEIKHQVHIVKVPKVITRKEVEEKVVPVPLPESCETAIDYAHLNIMQTNKANNQADKVYKYVDELDERLLSDSEAAHKSEQWLFEEADKMDIQNWNNLELAEEAESYYDLCMSDIKKAKDGDDVEAADGHHVTSP